MKIWYIILDRPCQYDHKIILDGYTNKVTFTHQESKIMLISLTPQQVREDEIKMKVKIEK